jgi:hypothetical protein
VTDRVFLTDDDPELARFFAGEDFTGDPIPDGGKAARPEDAGPRPGVVDDDLTTDEFWAAADAFDQ